MAQAIQTLLSLATVQGLTITDEPTLALLEGPELEALLAQIAQKLTDAPDAQAQAQPQCIATAGQQPASGEHGPSQPGHDCLLIEQQRLMAATEAQQRSNTAAAAAAARSYQRAEGQQAAVGEAVQALAGRLGKLQLEAERQGGAQLLSLGVPEGVAAGNTQLLQSLADLLGQAPGAAGGGAGPGTQAEAPHQRQQEEFGRLQDALQLAAAAKVHAQVEAARVQGELGFLRTRQDQEAQGGSGNLHSLSSAADRSAALLLGRSVEELEREVQYLQRKLEAELSRTTTAAQQAALRHAAAAVAQQRALRIKRTEERCVVKGQAVEVLVRHMARQRLVAELLRQERTALGQAQGLVQAALEDGAAVVAAAQQRLQQLYPKQQLEPPPPQEDVAARPGQQQHGSRVKEEEQPLDPEILQALSAALGPESGSGCSTAKGAELAAAVAEQLLQLRAGVRELSQHAQQEVIAGQRAVFAQLHGLAFRGADVRSPVLTEPTVQEKLAVASAAATALQQAATTALVEVQQRQGQQARRALQEQVLVDFFSNPANLSKLADQQRRALQA